MRLVLHRKYKATVTLGRLLLGKKQVCFTQEPPKACFGKHIACLDEGVYELDDSLGQPPQRPKFGIKEGVYKLDPIHSEERGWEIGIADIGKFASYPWNQPLESNRIYPVTSYRADGTPLFTKLAFLKLMERLEREWERGEIVELQIVSEPVPYLLKSCLEQSYC
ncbi:hypothetical protein LV84_04159 [Algoriphagus ratkowskyi]|uniref:DUF5675 domain-containing protein n=1 Tax=Algoriphagus ratkowskyi TaxID=57028 RepID=A0A2W7R719_9BACT|nr:hypothetical protein [Algoriphagus ratkowskyi]PZX49969.1 hypothetical protein LV84_04159 [Algoriphagus ratkowskyi]TXD75538.1 hypothetical protein ESW18_20210 [Algoriphagus ratkowskyi]